MIRTNLLKGQAMKVYRVHMQHWQRYLGTPPGATSIEHIEVIVEAPTGAAAARAAEALFDEWTIRCVTLEPDPRTAGR